MDLVQLLLEVFLAQGCPVNARPSSALRGLNGHRRSWMSAPSFHLSLRTPPGSQLPQPVTVRLQPISFLQLVLFSCQRETAVARLTFPTVVSSLQLHQTQAPPPSSRCWRRPQRCDRCTKLGTLGEILVAGFLLESSRTEFTITKLLNYTQNDRVSPILGQSQAI